MAWIVVRTAKAKVGGRICPIDIDHMVWPGDEIGLVRPGPRQRVVGWCCQVCVEALIGPAAEPGPWPEDLSLVRVFEAKFAARCGRSRLHRIAAGEPLGVALRGEERLLVCRGCMEGCPRSQIAVGGCWTKAADLRADIAEIEDFLVVHAEELSSLVELDKLFPR